MTKNILANLVGRFWSTLSNFLFVPFYIDILGFESYSIIGFTLIVAGFMAILDSGLTATLSREFARLDNTEEEKRKIFKTLESSYFLISTVVIIFIYSFSSFIAHNWLNLSVYKPEKISFFLKIIGFDIGLQLLFRFYMGGLIGLEKQVRANIIQIGWGVFRNGLVLIIILVEPKLELFFIWQLVTTIIFTTINRVILSNCFIPSTLPFFKFKIEKQVFDRIWRFASGMLLITLVSSFNIQLDKLVISKLLSIENLGYYTLSVSLSMILLTLVNPFSVALLPRFTALYSTNKNVEASKLFYRVNSLLSFLIFSVLANMFFFPKEIIWAWTGNMKLAVNVSTLLPIIVISYGMLALAVIPYSIAIANGYTKLNNIIGILSLIITLPGYWYATTNYGASGTALVFCFVQTITTLVYLYIIKKKFLSGILIYDLYVKRLLVPIFISLIIAYCFSLLDYFIISSRIMAIVYIGLSTFLTFAITLILLIPLKEIKESLPTKILN